MARVSVYLPDELAALIRDEMPSVNVSKILQDGLRGLLKCTHEEAVCASCAAPVDLAAVVEKAKGAYFSQLMGELQDHIAAGGTAEGVGRIAKAIAIAHGVKSAESRPLPRPSRAAQRRVADRAFYEGEVAAS